MLAVSIIYFSLFLLLVFYLSKRNPVFMFATLLIGSVFIYNFVDGDVIAVKGFLKIHDVILLFLLYKLFSTKMHQEKLLAQYSAWGLYLVLFLVIWIESAIVSLQYQTLSEMIRSYRFLLGWVTPFVFFSYIKTKDDYRRFLEYLCWIAVFLSGITIIESLYYTGFFLPFAKAAPDRFGYRLITNAIVLSSIAGPLSLLFFYTKQKRKYLIFFFIISLSVLLSFGRGFTTGYFIACFVTLVVLHFYYKNLFSVKGSYLFIPIIFIAIFYMGKSGLTDALTDRFVNDTQNQATEGRESEFLSGRWDRFNLRMEWVKEQNTFIQAMGPGILNPPTALVFDDNNNDFSNLYQICESAYLNTYLTNGYVGSFLLFGMFFMLIPISFYSYYKRKCDVEGLAITLSFVVFLGLSMVSGAGFEIYAYVIILGICMVMLNKNRIFSN